MAPPLTSARILLLADRLAAARDSLHGSAEVLKERGASAPAELAHLGMRLCTILSRYLCKLWNELGSGAVTDDFASEQASYISFAASHLDEGLVALLSPAALSMPPQGITLPVEDLVRQVAPGAKVIVRGEYAHNYEAFLEERAILEKLLPLSIPRDDALRGFAHRFFILNVPATQARHTLLHALLAHEVGHIMFQESEFKNRPADVLSTTKWLDELKEVFRGHPEAPPTESEFSVQFAQFKASTLRVVRAWFKELVSDFFGAKVLGPCYLFALRQFGVMGHPMDFTPQDGRLFEEYPSLRRRLKLVSEAVRPFLYGRPFRFTDPSQQRRVLRTLRKEVQVTQAEARAPEKPLPRMYQFARRLVDESVLRVQEAVEQAPPAYFYDPVVLADEMFELYERIADDIAPNELLSRRGPTVGRPAQWQSILNAAWAYRLWPPGGAPDGNPFRYRHQPVTEDETAQWRQKLMADNDFISRSIELSVVHGRFLRDRDSWGELFQ